MADEYLPTLEDLERIRNFTGQKRHGKADLEPLYSAYNAIDDVANGMSLIEAIATLNQVGKLRLTYQSVDSYGSLPSLSFESPSHQWVLVLTRVQKATAYSASINAITKLNFPEWIWNWYPLILFQHWYFGYLFGYTGFWGSGLSGLQLADGIGYYLGGTNMQNIQRDGAVVRFDAQGQATWEMSEVALKTHNSDLGQWFQVKHNNRLVSQAFANLTDSEMITMDTVQLGQTYNTFKIEGEFNNATVKAANITVVGMRDLTV